MAKLVGVLACSHLLYITDEWAGRPPESWEKIRDSRDIRNDVPFDSADERHKQADRVIAALTTLKQKLADMRPDVLLIVGNDHDENFAAPDFEIMPMITVFTGATFSGKTYEYFLDRSADARHVQVPGHPQLAQAILYGLIERGFDPAWSQRVPQPDKGIGHAIMHPIGYFTDYSQPVVPIIINTFYSPAISAKRCVALGRALRDIVDNHPSDLRVVAIGTGGLWHTTFAPDSWLNEEFDRAGMKLLAAGDIEGWASYFDSYDVSGDPSNQTSSEISRESSGMPQSPGPQFGTRETLDWITACAMADGRPFTVLDVIPAYSSPIDWGFAFCDSVG